MEAERSFRPDLFRGTAMYYDRYRPPYPEALLEDLCRRLSVSGRGRLLDLACGTGQLALPLAGRFAEVWAVDEEPESVAYGRAKAEAARVANIRWIAGAAEAVPLDTGFELVTVGNAFQRLDRPAVARRMYASLLPGGAVALVWGPTPWRGDRRWQRAMSALLAEWTARVGATDRVPAGWEQEMERRPHEQVLAEAGFDAVERVEFPVERTWTILTLSGFVYSTSFLNRGVLGDQAATFEQDLATVLRSVQREGDFVESASYAYELSRKPRP